SVTPAGTSGPRRRTTRPSCTTAGSRRTCGCAPARRSRPCSTASPWWSRGWYGYPNGGPAHPPMCRRTRSNSGPSSAWPGATADSPGGRRLAEVGRQGEAAFGRRATAGQVGDDLPGQRRELGAVTRAGRADDEGPVPVQDEVLVRGRGVQAGHLADRFRFQPGQQLPGELVDPVPGRRVDNPVPAVAGGAGAAAVLAYLDRARDFAVPPGGQAVPDHVAVPDERGPGLGDAGREVEGTDLGHDQRRQRHLPSEQRFQPCPGGHDHRWRTPR